MRVDRLRHMSPDDVRRALDAFAPAYVADWDVWMRTGEEDRIVVLGQVLRRWQACRPKEMRRPRTEATHPRPYLDDLVARAEGPIAELGDLTVASLGARTTLQGLSLVTLWRIFSELAMPAPASCVGISKAVLLLTNGRIGPALDSQVRDQLGLAKPTTAHEWIRALDGVAMDINAFEAAHGPLADIAPPRFRHLAVGRLYDMTFGPGSRPA